MEQKISSVKLAREMGVSRATIRLWVSDGCPSQKSWKGRKEVILFDLADVKKWLSNERKNVKNKQ